MKTPSWAGSEDIYFLILDENHNKYGYIGLQGLNFQKGICDNLCYKTHKKFRGQGKSKIYLQEFLDWCPLHLDIFKATVRRDNIPSIKMLEYCGFEEVVKTNEKLEREVRLLKKEIEVLEKKEEVETKVKIPFTSALPIKKKELARLESLLKKEKEYFSYRIKRFDF